MGLTRRWLPSVRSAPAAAPITLASATGRTLTKVPLSAGFGCYGYAIGPGAAAAQSPQWGAFATGAEPCPGAAGFFGASVTQEDPYGNHNTSANWQGPDWNYMADAPLPNAPDSWVQAAIANGVASVSLDAMTNPTAINTVTGWQRAYGHTFVGWNDLTAPAEALYGHNIIVEFDARITLQEQNPAAWPSTFSGSRVTLGMSCSNGSFLELDWEQGGYATSLNEPSAGLIYCQDAPYEACQYGPGYEVKFLSAAVYGAPPLGSVWAHVRLPITRIAKELTWFNRPHNGASVSFYFAVEGIGASRITAEFQNWNPYALITTPAGS